MNIVLFFSFINILITTCALRLDKFATKNTYNASSLSSTENHKTDNTSSMLEDDKKCRPVQIIMLLRHGIRYLGNDDIDNVNSVIRQFRSRFATASVVDELEKVVASYFPPSKAMQLAKTGAVEQRDIGERIGENYSKLFLSAAYDDAKFLVSSSQRAIDSCYNFQKGFIETHGFNVSLSKLTRDDLLRFFDLCPKYIKSVDKNKMAIREYTDFQQTSSPEINAHVAGRLGITELTLSTDEITSLYKMAAVEFAIVGSHLFTDLLSTSNLDLLEYAVDLKNYWKLGFGYPINYKQSCPLLADIFTNMDAAVNGLKYKKGVFYFGHAETTIPLMTLLGLFHDERPLKADNYRQQRDRQFRTSKISSFSSNVAFVLHECDSDQLVKNEMDSKSSDGIGSRRHMLELLVNERPVNIQSVSCSGKLCPYETIRRRYATYIDDCDFNKTCSLHRHTSLIDVSHSSSSSDVLSSLLLIVVLIQVLVLLWCAYVRLYARAYAVFKDTEREKV